MNVSKMNIPIEIFNQIIRYVDEPRLIHAFGDLLYKETISWLLLLTNIDKIIISGDIDLANSIKKYDESRFNGINWANLTFYNRLPNKSLIAYKDHVHWTRIITNYNLDDDDVIILADVIDWKIMIKKFKLSKSIRLKYVDVHFDYLELFEHQFIDDDEVRSYLDLFENQILDDKVRSYLDSSDEYQILIEKLDGLIFGKKLSSIVFREYIHIFKDNIAACWIVEARYDVLFFIETADLVDWGEVFRGFQKHNLIL